MNEPIKTFVDKSIIGKVAEKAADSNPALATLCVLILCLLAYPLFRSPVGLWEVVALAVVAVVLVALLALAILSGRQKTLPASAKGKWTYKSVTFDKSRMFTGTCDISQEKNGRIRISGTREKTYNWSSVSVAFDDPKLLIHYTINDNEGHHDALALITLRSEPFTEMEGNFFQLAVKPLSDVPLSGVITFRATAR